MAKCDIIWLDSSVELPGFIGDPTTIDWQTKTVFADCHTYKLTSDGRLLQAESTYEKVPLEDRPNPEADEGSVEAMEGAFKETIDEWHDMEPDGEVEFFAEVDGDLFIYEASFVDGELEEIQPVDESEFELEEE